MFGRNNFLRGAGGRFAGSTGGSGHVGGGKVLGGTRGVAARSRLRQALSKLEGAKVHAAGSKSKRTRHILARRERAVAVHQREVARVAKRGILDLKKRGDRRSSLKLSKGERLGIRQDRVFFARQRLNTLRTNAKNDALANAKQARADHAAGKPSIHGFSRRQHARAILKARRALKNRERELKRIS